MVTIDWTLIGLYFLGIFGISFYSLTKNKGQSVDFFLGGRDLGWLAVGASLFMTNIGSEHLVGLAGSGAAGGLAVGHFEWLASLILLLLGWFFAPYYFRSGVFTMPEFLERRYNSTARWYFSVISIIGYVLTKISVGLYAGGVIFQVALGVNLWVGIALVVIFTGLYTILGGLRAIAYVDILQMFVMILGTGFLLFLGLHRVGGWHALQTSVPTEFFHMWKPMSDPNFPWTGIVLGAPILGIWYWCTDQYIVQRVISAKNLETAQTGTILSGFLKITPVFLFIVPGIIASVLFKDLTPETSNQALPRLFLYLLGPGFRGLFLAALLSALMSSLASVFNSCSTLVTYDIFKKMRPGAGEKELISVGRITVGFLILLGLLWIPFMKYISPQLYLYLQSVQGYIAPPIAACFLLGILFKRLNGVGALASLLSGLCLGALRFVLEIYCRASGGLRFPAGSFLRIYTEINFLHFAAILFLISSIILVGVSLLTSPPTSDQMKLVARMETGPIHLPKTSQTQLNTGLTILLVGIMIALWVFFA